MTTWHPVALEGVRLIELGKIEEGRLLLRQAVGAHPYEAWPYLKLAEVEETANSKIHLYEKSLEVEITDWAFIGLIRTHISEDRLEAAYRCYVRAKTILEDISRLRDLLPRMVEAATVFENASFDWRAYLAKRPTLSTKDKNPVDVAVKHYLDVGRHSRPIEEDGSLLPGGFNRDIYCLLNPETHDLTEEQILTHFFDYNIHDAHVYALENVPRDFEPARYRMLNLDLATLTDREATLHYANHGCRERRVYNTGMVDIEDFPFSVAERIRFERYRNNCVVLINHQPTLTGAPIFLRAFANILSREGHFSNMIILDPIPAPKLDELIERDDIERLSFNNDPALLEQILLFLNPVLVYSNSMNLFLKDLERYNYLKYRAIFHLHETALSIELFRAPEVLREQLLYAVSESIQTDFQKLGLEKVRLFPPFLHERVIKRMDEALVSRVGADSSSSDHRRIKIGMCGWICERKGFDLFQYIAEHRKDLEFIWIGGQEQDVEGFKTDNLTIIPLTTNPYEYLIDLDYFFLTSKEDPCPLVLLEALYLNLKVILLEGGCRYDHPIVDLENVTMLKQHDFEPQKVLEALASLPLDSTPNKSTRNITYVEENFTRPRILSKRRTPKRDIISLSYYVAPGDSPSSWHYYTNLINQFLLRHDHEFEVIVQFASATTIPEDLKEHFRRGIRAPLRMFQRPNRGYDIGGLADTVHTLFQEDPDKVEYLVYLHTKGNPVRREHLQRIMFSDNYRDFDTVASDSCIQPCTPSDLNRPVFFRHDVFAQLCGMSKPFDFVAGTTFITKLNHLQLLHDRYDEINERFTDLHTDDTYWRELMLNEKVFSMYRNSPEIPRLQAPIDHEGPEIIRTTGCKNYFELLHIYGKRGIPDCQFEHALERFVGHLILTGKRVGVA